MKEKKNQFHKQKKAIILFYDRNYSLFVSVIFRQEIIWWDDLLHCMR